MHLSRLALSLALIAAFSPAQDLDFQAAARAVVRLPPAAFPILPQAVRRELQRRNCTIPQESYSKHPNNVIGGQFAKPGQKDWAVLCSRNGASSILVFWNGSASNPAELAQGDDIDYLQGDQDGRINFSRGIAAAGSDFILQHYRAYGGPQPPALDHQGIDDAFLEKASVVHYFSAGKWLQLTGSD